MNKKNLGRGLSSLLSEANLDLNDEVSLDASESSVEGKSFTIIPIEKIIPNKDQPRKFFHEQELEDLKVSIRARGLLQPIIVRKKGDLYEIVAGERRWRASQLAQIHELPAIVRNLSDAEVFEIAIIENIQRSDLNPYEEACGYKDLLEKYNYTQEKLGSILGKSRVYISNMIRLLHLPNDVLKFLQDGKITTGHARALVGLEESSELAKEVVKKGFSVRETERMVRKYSQKKLDPKMTKIKKDSDTKMLERDLSAELGVSVSIDHNNGSENGRLILSYRNLEQLDKVIGIIMKKNI